jgi:hypothetical protein
MDYKPLADLIEPYLASPLDAIPRELQERIAGVNGLLPTWDTHLPSERRAIVRRRDKQNIDKAYHGVAMAKLLNTPFPTPEESEEYASAFPLLDEIEACEIEIARWEKIGDQSVPSEKQRKAV